MKLMKIVTPGGRKRNRQVVSFEHPSYLLQVISGLNQDDILITTGAHLLDSEAIFKNGNDNIASMKT
jgi:Cu(I)/Ag(I) efflux system membrane fusion protein